MTKEEMQLVVDRLLSSEQAIEDQKDLIEYLKTPTFLDDLMREIEKKKLNHP